MSGRHHHRSNRTKSSHHTLASVARETAVALLPDSPVLAVFRAAALKLNDRQDRHERLVKLSRDITIESKRIIFLLHSAVVKESLEKILKEADDRLQKLIKGPIKSIGLELENSPAHLHYRAVTAGLQEYVEARTLYSLMASKEIITVREVAKEFSFTIKTEDEVERTVATLIPEIDYMLGLADLTGELMRKAINSISSGDSDECFHACQVVRDLFTGFLGVTGSRILSKKLNVTRANVAKVEMAVYALRVRGGEAPPLLLIAPTPSEWDAPQGSTNFSDDEGYY